MNTNILHEEKAFRSRLVESGAKQMLKVIM